MEIAQMILQKVLSQSNQQISLAESQADSHTIPIKNETLDQNSAKSQTDRNRISNPCTIPMLQREKLRDLKDRSLKQLQAKKL